MNNVLNQRILLTWVFLSLALFTPRVSCHTTVLSPNQRVPEGDEIQLTCTSKRVQTDDKVKHHLYIVSEQDAVPVPPSQVKACEKSYTYSTATGTASITTVFTMEASQETAGTYGCLPLLESAPPLSLSLNKIKVPATVTVCSEPELEVSQIATTGNFIFLRGTKNCDFKGELSWFVNGQRVQRDSETKNADFPAVERNDSSLEVHTEGCDDSLDNICQITAVFKYISTDFRLRNVSKSREINGCCVPDVSRQNGVNESANDEVPDSSSSVISPPYQHPLDVLAEKSDLEREVLSLQKDVLQLKLEALPMQIRFFKRLNRDHADAREREKASDI